jgi:hypothetical protein
MSNLKKELAEKRQLLKQLIRSRSTASCASVVSKEADVRREMEISDLEEEIRKLEEKIGT